MKLSKKIFAKQARNTKEEIKVMKFNLIGKSINFISKYKFYKYILIL